MMVLKCDYKSRKHGNLNCLRQFSIITSLHYLVHALICISFTEPKQYFNIQCIVLDLDEENLLIKYLPQVRDFQINLVAASTTIDVYCNEREYTASICNIRIQIKHLKYQMHFWCSANDNRSLQTSIFDKY